MKTTTRMRASARAQGDEATETISRHITGRGQNTALNEVLAAFGAKLRVSIRTDSYPEQMHARVERWDGSAWRELHFIPPLAMKTEAKLGYRLQQPPMLADYAADRDELLRVARALLVDEARA